jgi:G2/mitotic-specific cyclin 3/4
MYANSTCQTPEHVHYSGYTFAQIESLTHLILECCHIAEKHHFAVLEKYSDKRFKKCALYVKNQLQAGFVLDPSPSPTASMVVPRLEDIQSNWDFTSTTIERMPIPMHG